MMTREDEVDAVALHRQGWTISAIARHLGHDRKPIRAKLEGGRVLGHAHALRPTRSTVRGARPGASVRGPAPRGRRRADLVNASLLLPKLGSDLPRRSHSQH